MFSAETSFKVLFPETKLGIKLQDQGAGLLPVVSGLPYGHSQIQVGDQLLAVNEVPLSIYSQPFALGIKLVASTERPVELLFRRPLPGEGLQRASSRSSYATVAFSEATKLGEAPRGLSSDSSDAPSTHRGVRGSSQRACLQCTHESNRVNAACCNMCAFSRYDSKCLTWSNAGAATLWHIKAMKCDLFEGHGFALTDSLRVIGVAAESAACRYHIPAGAYVIAVDGLRVRTLFDFRHCLAMKLAAANREVSYESQLREKRRRLTMPPPLNVAMRSNHKKRKLEASNFRVGSNLEDGNCDRAWCTLELKVPLETFAGYEAQIIDDVTLLSSSPEALELDSSVLEKIIAEQKSADSARAIVPAETPSVESWEVGDAVCWSKGDDELPNDAIGRVLRLHSGGSDADVVFPTARGVRRVFTFAAAALDRVLVLPTNELEVVLSSSNLDDTGAAANVADSNIALALEATASSETNDVGNEDLTSSIPSSDGSSIVSYETNIGVVVASPACSATEQPWQEERNSSNEGSNRPGQDDGDEIKKHAIKLKDGALAAAEAAASVSPSCPSAVKEGLQPSEKRQSTESKDVVLPETSKNAISISIRCSFSTQGQQPSAKMSPHGQRIIIRSKSQELIKTSSTPKQRSSSLPRKFSPHELESGGSSFVANTSSTSQVSLGHCRVRPPPPRQRPKTSPSAARYAEGQSNGASSKSISSSNHSSSAVKPIRKTRVNSHPSVPRPPMELNDRHPGVSPPRSRLRVRSNSQDRNRTAPAQEQRHKSLPRNLPSKNKGSSGIPHTSSSSVSTAGRSRAQSRIERSTSKNREVGAREPMLDLPPAPPPRRRPNASSSGGMRPPPPNRRPLKSPVARCNGSKIQSSVETEVSASLPSHGAHAQQSRPRPPRVQWQSKVPKNGTGNASSNTAGINNSDRTGTGNASSNTAGINNSDRTGTGNASSNTAGINNSDRTSSIRRGQTSPTTSIAVPRTTSNNTSSSRHVRIRSQEETRKSSAPEQHFSSMPRSLPSRSGSTSASTTSTQSTAFSSPFSDSSADRNQVHGSSKRVSVRSRNDGLSSSHDNSDSSCNSSSHSSGSKNSNNSNSTNSSRNSTHTSKSSRSGTDNNSGNKHAGHREQHGRQQK